MQPFTLRHRLQHSRLCVQHFRQRRELNVENKARRTSPQLYRHRAHLCVEKHEQQLAQWFRSRCRHAKTLCALRFGVHPEIDRGNHAESAERADHQLVQVIAGDVLHHFAAGVGDGPIGQYNRHPDNQVA
jgi:hypothetical protein